MKNIKELELELIELWKDIPEYEGLYQISNLGNVKSLKRFVKTRGEAYREEVEKILNPTKNHDYLRVNLSKNNKTKLFRVHRLVALVFIENPNNYSDVNHKNGIKSDNRVNNLEWCSKSQNQLHAVRLGLKKSGEDHKKSILSNKEASEIRSIYEKGGVTQAELGKLFNCPIYTISQIIRNKSYKNV